MKRRVRLPLVSIIYSLIYLLLPLWDWLRKNTWIICTVFNWHNWSSWYQGLCNPNMRVTTILYFFIRNIHHDLVSLHRTPSARRCVTHPHFSANWKFSVCCTYINFSVDCLLPLRWSLAPWTGRQTDGQAPLLPPPVGSELCLHYSYSLITETTNDRSINQSIKWFLEFLPTFRMYNRQIPIFVHILK